MKILVALGNPGKEYECTRHNVGFLLLDNIAKRYLAEAFAPKKEFKALISEGRIAGEKVLFVKPQTFMNLSGQSVRALMNFYKCEAEDICIMYDDIDIPLGTLRFREKGSPGTHNGMKSVVQEAATQEVPRIRIGIQPDQAFRGDLSSFVLGKLTEDELAAVYGQEDEVVEMIEAWVRG